MNYKKDFPIFGTHPSLVYMDSAATTQKPQEVIDAVSHYLQSSNSNIHRGAYKIAEESEEAYWMSKVLYSTYIGAKPHEIIYTYNATYAFNMIAQSLVFSKKLQTGDVVLIPLREHHANIVPRQMMAEQYGIIIEFISITNDYDIDRDDFQQKMTQKVKAVAISMCSNSTGTIIDVQKAKKIAGNERIVIVDGSQIVGKRAVDVDILGCDVFIATAHKMYAQSGLGMLYIRKDLMNQLKSPRGGGAMIEDVTSLGYTAKSNREGREPGTPNIVGAVSLGAAIQYLNKQGMTSLQQHDDELISYFLEKFNHLLTGKYTLHGKKSAEQRIGIFSLTPKDTTINMVLLGEKLGLQGIAVRTGGHCTHPYRHSQGLHGSIRMSTACYTEKKDIDVCINELMKQTTVGSS